MLPAPRIETGLCWVSMRIALGIVQLFPEGGLQRDCIRLARILVARGHDVTIFTVSRRWSVRSAALPDRRASRSAPRPITGIDLNFAKRFAAATAAGFDRVVGFNKLTGLRILLLRRPVHPGSRPQSARTARCRGTASRRCWSGKSFGPLQTHPNPGIDQIIGGELSPRLANTGTANHRARPSIDPDAPAARTAIAPPSRGDPCQTWHSG